MFATIINDQVGSLWSVNGLSQADNNSSTKLIVELESLLVVMTNSDSSLQDDNSPTWWTICCLCNQEGDSNVYTNNQ